MVHGPHGISPVSMPPIPGYFAHMSHMKNGIVQTKEQS